MKCTEVSLEVKGRYIQLGTVQNYSHDDNTVQTNMESEAEAALRTAFGSLGNINILPVVN